MLGKKLLPSFPITILTILQTAEAGASLGTASGSYGYLYEALITSALAKASNRVADIDTKYTYIAHLAQAFYRVGATSGLSREDIDQISNEYFSGFRIKFSVTAMLSELERAQILTTIGGNYVFKYKYVYCYFVARYFRDNVANSSELRAELKRISSRLHVEDYANILVFYLYLTRDIELIENVLKIARQVYADHEPCDFDIDVEFVNRLYVDTETLLLPSGEPATHREEEREQRDLTETGGDDQDVRELPYGDDLDDVLKVNFALKTLHVMGQVLRNFPGSLQATVKADLASESYLLGLRTLKAILRIAETNLDDLRSYLARLIQEHRRISAVSELEKSTDEAVIWITLNYAFGMTKRISSAVGLHELSGTFADVLEQLGAPLAVTRPGIFVPAKVRENLMEEDKTDANAEVQTGTDRNGAETDRGGHGEWEVDAAGLQGGWDSYSDVLSVAEGVWRSEGGAGQTAEGVGERKHPVETTGSRAVAGEAGVTGCSGGKLLSPERRRCAVERAEMRYGMSERHACRLLGQSRGTQRYEPMRRADEDRLTAAVVALASEYGRYGYKKIAAMLQRSGWQEWRGSGGVRG